MSSIIKISIPALIIILSANFLCDEFMFPTRGKPYRIPVQHLPVARLSSGDTVQVGQYVILDGSGSTPGVGKKIKWWEWDQNPGNPVELNVFSGDFNKKYYAGFDKEGVYRFYLSITNDSDQVSSQDSVDITVLPRELVVFENPNLEVDVRIELQMPVEDLTPEALLTLTFLQAKYYSPTLISSLNGLELCTNLEELLIQGQRVSDLSPISTLTNLTKLHFSENHIISDITPLANLVNLREIHMWNNKVADISALAGLTKMEELKTSYNPIENISALANMKELKHIYLSGAPLNDISPISGLTQLEKVWFAGCEIIDLTPLKHLTNLRIVNFKYNNVTDISPLAGLARMEWAYFSDNQISDITALEQCTGLNRVKLSGNQITNILPLVNNVGIGMGDLVALTGNPLDSLSIYEYIPILKNRGVHVSY